MKRLANDFTKSNDRMKDEIVAKVDSIQKEVQTVKKEVKVIDKKVDDHEKRIKALESGGANARGGGREDFVPHYLEVKGFCTWEERKTKGVTGADIRKFVASFKESLNEEQKGWVGAPEVRGFKMYKFKVKVDPEFIWETKELWIDFVTANNVTLADPVPYFIVERSPESQKVFNKMGASFAKLQKKILSPKLITAEWKERQFNIKASEQAAEHALVKIMDDLSLVWDTEGVTISGFSEAELIEALV